MSECPESLLYGSHSDSWHNGGTCDWCGSDMASEVAGHISRLARIACRELILEFLAQTPEHNQHLPNPED